VQPACRLKGQANDLPAPLAPEKLVKIVPEKETDLSQVFAHLNYSKFLHTNHLNKPIPFEDDIPETYVKVFDN